MIAVQDVTKCMAGRHLPAPTHHHFNLGRLCGGTCPYSTSSSSSSHLSLDE